MFPETATMVFCIGAQKAGTTWLYDTLRQSPRVHFSPNKELHYFDVVAGKAQQVLDLRMQAAKTLAQRLRPELGQINNANLQQLRDLTSLLTIYGGLPGDHRPYLDYLLDGYEEQDIVCDITPAYAILDRDTFADMGNIGSAKFLFILRDPVERMWSQIRMATSLANSTDTDFEARCIARARMLIDTNRLSRIERADYRRTITELEAAIPEQRIHYIFYETMFSQDTLCALSQFLGVPTLQGNPSHRANHGITAVLPDDMRAAFRSAFAVQYAFARDRFGPRVPAEWGAHNLSGVSE